jgi:hypothetical protein
MTPEMAREGFRNLLGELTCERLHEVQKRAFAGRGVLLPGLVFHVLAGNLFVSGIESMIHASLCGACSIVRCSAHDRTIPFLWKEALDTVVPRFGSTVEITYWPSSDLDLTRSVAAIADVTVAFGSDRAVETIRGTVPVYRRFVGHGHMVSFAIIGREQLESGDASSLAQRLAYDFSVHDQQGCLSPRAAFLETDSVEQARAFGELLCEAMRELAGTLPRHDLSLPEKAELARARDKAMIDAATGKFALLLSSPTDPFLATISEAVPYEFGSTNRHCDLRLFTDEEQVGSLLEPHAGRIAAIGIGGSHHRWKDLLLRLRVSRVCQIGEMQRPPFGWIHDGRPPMIDLLTFLGVEDQLGL